MFWWHRLCFILRFYSSSLILFTTCPAVLGATLFTNVSYASELVYMKSALVHEGIKEVFFGDGHQQCSHFKNDKFIPSSKVSESGKGVYITKSREQKTAVKTNNKSIKNRVSKNASGKKKSSHITNKVSKQTSRNVKHKRVTKKVSNNVSGVGKNSGGGNKKSKKTLGAVSSIRTEGKNSKKTIKTEKSGQVVNKISRESVGGSKEVHFEGSDDKKSPGLRENILLSLNWVINKLTDKKIINMNQKVLVKEDNEKNKQVLVKEDNEKSKKVLSVACGYMGTPYVYGGNTKLGIDCSGLVCSSYKEVGVNLPRVTSQMKKHGTIVSINKLKPGDLVFFGASPGSKKVVHVGIIIGKREGGISFIHASSSAGVTESLLKSSYHASRYLFAKRVIKS